MIGQFQGNAFASGKSIQTLLSIMLISMVLLISTPLLFFYSHALQSIQLSAERQTIQKSIQIIHQEIRQTGLRAEASVDQLASIIMTPDSRLSQIKLLLHTLSQNRDLQSAYVGHVNGQFIELRRIDDDSRQVFGPSPTSAIWLLQEHPPHSQDSAVTEQFSYLGAAGQRIGPVHHRVTNYHPAKRPWFRLAQQATGVTHTNLYLFATTGTPGITYAKQLQNNGVVAANTQLLKLQNLLQQQSPSLHAQLFLLNENEQLIASNLDAHSSVGSLLQTVLDQQGKKGHNADLQRRISIENETWQLSMSTIYQKESPNFRLLVLVPEREIFAEGWEITHNAIRLPILILLLILPFGWYLARWISKPIRQLVAMTLRIQAMDFDMPPMAHTPVKEMNTLLSATESMKETIRDFIGLSRQIVAETETTQLLQTLLHSAQTAMQYERGAIWLLQDQTLRPCCSRSLTGETLDIQPIALSDDLLSSSWEKNHASCFCVRPAWLPIGMRPLIPDEHSRMTVFILRQENQTPLGLLAVAHTESGNQDIYWGRVNYLKALVSFASIALHNRQMAYALQQLMKSLVELIANAIDTKSPYTGGHCQRVPVVAKALAEAVEQSHEAPFADFTMDENDRQSLFFASWLHDCGKVTTPEYVVDKATKLETIYNRIHEIRTRFEVLKRDADIHYWQGRCNGERPDKLQREHAETIAKLDADYAFVAHCNIGSETMSDADLARLAEISERRWTRTLDDRIGLGHLELERAMSYSPSTLPVVEKLLDDKNWHCQPWSDHQQVEEGYVGFTLKRPEHQSNGGELYNLSIRRGTLTEEERYKINEHIIVTIKMLRSLPLPPQLQQVPEIAGGHHERIDGKGYPRSLHGGQMSVLAKVMAIADVFEALTASDRPYREAKPMSEVLNIMISMGKDGHLDIHLLRLFLQNNVWRDYALRYLPTSLQDIHSATPYLERLAAN